MGLAFLVIVYLLPDGITGRLEQLWTYLRKPRVQSEPAAVKEPA
jgi:hypothetical protein